MEQSSSLPFLLVSGFLGGVLLAVLTLWMGNGWLLALLAYSLGGALSLLLSAFIMFLRTEAVVIRHEEPSHNYRPQDQSA